MAKLRSWSRACCVDVSVKLSWQSQGRIDVIGTGCMENRLCGSIVTGFVELDGSVY